MYVLLAERYGWTAAQVDAQPAALIDELLAYRQAEAEEQRKRR